MNLDIMSLMAASAALSDPQAGTGEGATAAADSLEGVSPEATFASILQSVSVAIENVDESLPALLPDAEAALAELPDEASSDALGALPEALESAISGTPGGNLSPENGNELPLAAREALRAPPPMAAQSPAESPLLAPAGPPTTAVTINPGVATASASALAGEQGASAAGWFSQRSADDPRAASQRQAPGVTLATDAAAHPEAMKTGRTRDAQPATLLVERGSALPNPESIVDPKSVVLAERLNTLAVQSAALNGTSAPADLSGGDLSRLSTAPGGTLAPSSTSPTAPSAGPPLAAALNINQAGWDKALGQRLVFMASNGLDSAELRLDPPQLGTVHVKLSMQGDQAQVVLQAANPLARDAMETALPRLRDMLGAEGLALDSAQVSDRDSGHRQRATDYGSEARADDTDDETAETPESTDTATRVETLTPHSGGIYERV